MKSLVCSWLGLGVIGCLLVFGGVETVLSEERILPAGMTPEKLEKSVVRKQKYIDSRLLSGKSADRINNSGNQAAINILNRAREESKEIGKLIGSGEYESAYWALQDLNKLIKTALKLSRAKAVAKKETTDKLESVRISSDAYLDRARQRQIDTRPGLGDEVKGLYMQALDSRSKASSVAGKNPQAAIAHYEKSISLLQQAISLGKDVTLRKLKHDLAAARLANDDLLEKAKSKNIGDGALGREALVLYEHAMEERAKANDAEKSKIYQLAVEHFRDSTELFERSIKASAQRTKNSKGKETGSTQEDRSTDSYENAGGFDF